MLRFIEERPIPGHENYTTDKYGDVYSRRSGKVYKLKQFVSNTGYKIVTIYSSPDNKKKITGVHRLVAAAWLNNPEQKPMVNHKDGVRTNNKLKNLEYVTAKENSIHAIKTGLKKPFMRPVVQLNKDSSFVAEYQSSDEAYKSTGINASSISSVCRKIRKTAGGFIWVFKENYKSPKPKKIQLRRSDSKVIEKYDLDGNFIESYPSIMEAAKQNNCGAAGISLTCSGKQKSAKGMVWKYAVVEEVQEIGPTAIEIETEDWEYTHLSDMHKVSRDGRVYSVKYKKYMLHQLSGKYHNVNICNTTVSVHRLVAMVYIQNPRKLNIINHIDGNPSNNTVENLEWCTTEENVTHAYKTGLNKKSKKVIQLRNNKKINTYHSIGEAARSRGVSRCAIANVLAGRSQTSGGYGWKFG